jgi:tetratricopeptide (TPR) repeat protein
MLAVDEGDYVRAREELERALSTFEEIYADERTIIGEIYLGLGRCALAEGDDAAARALLRRAEAELMPRLAEGHRIRVQLDQSLAQLGDTNR